MKKFFTFILFFLCSMSAFSVNPSDKLIGEWTNEHVKITFTNDSLFIDEIDNEGFGYSYNMRSDDTLIYSNDMDTDFMDIVYVDDKIIKIRYSEDTEVYTFKKNIKK